MRGFAFPRQFRESTLAESLSRNMRELVTFMNSFVVRFDDDGESVTLPGDLTVTGTVTHGGPVGERFPVGGIMPFAGSSAPTGYLLCDGAAVSRTTYATLFALVSTTYGAGDGSTTFNLPNLKGRTVVGVDASQTEFDTLGETGGAKTHTLTTAEMPSHSHTNYGALVPRGTAAVFRELTSTPGSNNVDSGTAGSGNAHNNLQPYIALSYIVRAL